MPAFLCLLWEFAGIYCTDTYVVMAAAAAIVHEGGRKKEQKGEMESFQKGTENVGGRQEVHETLRALLILSSVQH